MNVMNLRIVPEIWRAWRVGGYSCTVTEDVPGMLKEIEAGEVDLVLLDVSLTSAQWQGQLVNGVELCQILKKKSPRRLPILLATARTPPAATVSVFWKPPGPTATLKSRRTTPPY
jgi:CheY-like chemotaxis protein